MYQDDLGNVWASYEDYQDYLKMVSEITKLSDEVLENVVKENVKTENKIVESGQNNE